MNLNNQPTIDQLARLFASQKDTLDSHILWVCDEGEVRLDRLSPHTHENEFEKEHPNMSTRLKMYRRGHGYVGKKAAADRDFIGTVLDTLQSEWPGPKKQQGVRVVERLC